MSVHSQLLPAGLKSLLSPILLQLVFTSGGHKYLDKTVNFQRRTGLEVVLCTAFTELCGSTEVQKDCSEEKFGKMSETVKSE